jgi:hypothetical protein
MKNMLLLVLLVASAAVAEDVISKSIVIEPNFNVGFALDPAALKMLGPNWSAGKMIPGLVSNSGRLGTLGLANTKAGDKVNVTYLGHDGTKEKFQVEHIGSGRTEVIRVALGAPPKK